jgi:hypothetical protein
MRPGDVINFWATDWEVTNVERFPWRGYALSHLRRSGAWNAPSFFRVEHASVVIDDRVWALCAWTPDEDHKPRLIYLVWFGDLPERQETWRDRPPLL